MQSPQCSSRTGHVRHSTVIVRSWLGIGSHPFQVVDAHARGDHRHALPPGIRAGPGHAGRGTADSSDWPIQVGTARATSVGASTSTRPDRTASAQPRSPRQISVIERSEVRTVAVTSNPGSTSQTSTSSPVDADPPPRDRRGDVVEPHRDDRATPRPLLDGDGAPHVPQQQARVEVLLAEVARPPGTPGAQGVDDRAQLQPALGQLVGAATRHHRAPHHPDPLQPPQPLRQQRRRHLRVAPAQLVEVPAAEQQLAHHQQGPALVEHLHRLRDRAELAVGRHGHHLLRGPPPGPGTAHPVHTHPRRRASTDREPPPLQIAHWMPPATFATLEPRPPRRSTS